MRNLLNRVAVVLSLLVLLSGCQRHTSNPTTSFYLQLVRGNDQDSPPEQECKPVGPILAARLQSVFKWHNYWEISRDTAVVTCGQKVRRSLSAERQVEIELLDPSTMKVRVYVNGRLMRCRTQPVRHAFYIAGGDKGDSASWFVVVRHDRPQEPVPATNPVHEL